jgi:hypothetical protein
MPLRRLGPGCFTMPTNGTVGEVMRTDNHRATCRRDSGRFASDLTVAIYDLPRTRVTKPA